MTSPKPPAQPNVPAEIEPRDILAHVIAHEYGRDKKRGGKGPERIDYQIAGKGIDALLLYFTITPRLRPNILETKDYDDLCSAALARRAKDGLEDRAVAGGGGTDDQYGADGTDA